MLWPARIAVVAVAAISCTFVAACAGKGEAGQGEAVVTVEGKSIDRAQVAHWVSVEAVTSHEVSPSSKPPKGWNPVPPEYTDCIALSEQESTATPKPTKAQLKSTCAAKYEMLKRQVLELLITYRWMDGEGKAKGVTIDNAELQQYLQRSFPTKAALHRFLSLTGESLADQELLARRVLYSIKLEKALARRAHIPIEQAITRFGEELAAKWAPRTSCKPGYIVPQCKQSKGPHTL